MKDLKINMIIKVNVFIGTQISTVVDTTITVQLQIPNSIINKFPVNQINNKIGKKSNQKPTLS
jgi:hypothetical protein